VSGEYARREGGPALLAPAAAALGVLLIAVAQIWQAVEQKSSRAGFEPPGPVGSLESVQLTNGLALSQQAPMSPAAAFSSDDAPTVSALGALGFHGGIATGAVTVSARPNRPAERFDPGLG
jgi:hypothetical protein